MNLSDKDQHIIHVLIKQLEELNHLDFDVYDYIKFEFLKLRYI